MRREKYKMWLFIAIAVFAFMSFTSTVAICYIAIRLSIAYDDSEQMNEKLVDFIVDKLDEKSDKIKELENAVRPPDK